MPQNAERQAKTFESSLEELEAIVRELEQGELPLEKSLELFEQGVKLSRECQERLNQAERRIEILMRDNQGRPTVRPFEPESDVVVTKLLLNSSLCPLWLILRLHLTRANSWLPAALLSIPNSID